jgi:hypothetical protein
MGEPSSAGDFWARVNATLQHADVKVLWMLTRLHGLYLFQQGPCCLRQLGSQLLVPQLCTLAAAL